MDEVDQAPDGRDAIVSGLSIDPPVEELSSASLLRQPLPSWASPSTLPSDLDPVEPEPVTGYERPQSSDTLASYESASRSYEPPAAAAPPAQHTAFPPPAPDTAFRLPINQPRPPALPDVSAQGPTDRYRPLPPSSEQRNFSPPPPPGSALPPPPPGRSWVSGSPTRPTRPSTAPTSLVVVAAIAALVATLLSMEASGASLSDGVALANYAAATIAIPLGISLLVWKLASPKAGAVTLLVLALLSSCASLTTMRIQPIEFPTVPAAVESSIGAPGFDSLDHPQPFVAAQDALGNRCPCEPNLR